MRTQSLTGKFPTERPPDSDNGSPGTVGTVTEAKIQTSVLPRTTPTYTDRNASVQPAALSACDRQDRIGSIAEHDGEHHACDVTLTEFDHRAFWQKWLLFLTIDRRRLGLQIRNRRMGTKRRSSGTYQSSTRWMDSRTGEVYARSFATVQELIDKPRSSCRVDRALVRISNEALVPE